MHENQISGIVLDACIKIHRVLGPGLFESVYEEVLEHELLQRGLKVKRQYPIPVIYEGMKLEKGFRADLIIDDKVIIEIKAVESITPLFYSQLNTYLKLSGLKLGLLINFNEFLIKNGFKRQVNKL
jgi:GxxExxY protein